MWQTDYTDWYSTQLHLSDGGSRETDTFESIYHVSSQPEIREALGGLSLQCRVLHTRGRITSGQPATLCRATYSRAGFYDDGFHFSDRSVVNSFSSMASYRRGCSPVQWPAQEWFQGSPAHAHAAELRGRGCTLNRALPVCTI